MTGYFYGKQIIYRHGETDADSYSQVGTTLKIVPKEGYFSGTDKVLIDDEEFIAPNILDSASIFGLEGTIPHFDSDQVTTNVSNDGTTLKLKAPEGFYDGTLNVTVTDSAFIAGNIKDGVTMFGVTGTLAGGGGVIATGQNQDNSKNTGDDGDTQRGIKAVGGRFVDNLDNTVEDKLTNITYIKDLSKISISGFVGITNKSYWAEETEYSEGDIVRYPPSVPGWQESRLYYVGDIVTGEMSQVFVCKLEHTSTYEDFPPNSPNWQDYWEEGGYPVPPAWVNGQQYHVGDEISYSMWEGSESYTCIRDHTASWDNNPMEGGMYPGAVICWVRKNNWFVCIDNHEADLTKNCHNKLYWSELPFYNDGNLKKETPEKIISVANQLDYLNSSWEIPNVFELGLTINYGITEGAKTELPDAVADAYFTGTNTSNEWGEYSYFYVNYANGNIGTTYSAYPIFKKKEEEE